MRNALILFAATVLAGCAGAPSRSTSHLRVDGRQARTLVAEGAFLLDVRTPEEFADGHIEGAVNVPVQSLRERLDEVPRDRPIVVYCQSGRRSAAAAAILEQAGYEAIHDLGGIGNW